MYYQERTRAGSISIPNCPLEDCQLGIRLIRLGRLHAWRHYITHLCSCRLLSIDYDQNQRSVRIMFSPASEVLPSTPRNLFTCLNAFRRPLERSASLLWHVARELWIYAQEQYDCRYSSCEAHIEQEAFLHHLLSS
jgi:hypothetical protein